MKCASNRILLVLTVMVAVQCVLAVSAQQSQQGASVSSKLLLAQDSDKFASGTTSSTADGASDKAPAGGTPAEDASGGGSADESERSVKLNNLANLEALLNIIVNGCEILGVLLFLPILVLGIAGAIIGGKQRWIGFALIGVAFFFLIGGLLMPALVNWLVNSARDANLFS